MGKIKIAFFTIVLSLKAYSLDLAVPKNFKFSYSSVFTDEITSDEYRSSGIFTYKSVNDYSIDQMSPVKMRYSNKDGKRTLTFLGAVSPYDLKKGRKVNVSNILAMFDKKLRSNEYQMVIEDKGRIELLIRNTAKKGHFIEKVVLHFRNKINTIENLRELNITFFSGKRLDIEISNLRIAKSKKKKMSILDKERQIVQCYHDIKGDTWGYFYNLKSEDYLKICHCASKKSDESYAKMDVDILGKCAYTSNLSKKGAVLGDSIFVNTVLRWNKYVYYEKYKKVYKDIADHRVTRYSMCLAANVTSHCREITLGAYEKCHKTVKHVELYKYHKMCDGALTDPRYDWKDYIKPNMQLY